MRDEINVIISRHLTSAGWIPALRPAGVLPVEIVCFAYPREDLAARLAADDSARDDSARDGDAPYDTPDNDTPDTASPV